MSVFTKISHTELRDFLGRYPVEELLGFQGIGEGVENTNYYVDTADGRWVLTIFERLNHADLPFFLGLMEHLADRGIPTARPVHLRNGGTLTTFRHKPAALVHRLVGQSVLFPTAAQCGAAGALLGDLHAAGASYPGTCRNSRGPEWRKETAAALLPKVGTKLARVIRNELKAQAELDLAALPQGVIHADLFRDNVLFVGERLSGVIDFYYACTDALLYDVAVTLNDWCFDTHGRLDARRAKALLAAYRRRRRAQIVEREAWALTLRAAAFRFWLSRLYDWHFPREGDVVHVKDPEEYRRILEHHRNNAPPAL